MASASTKTLSVVIDKEFYENFYEKFEQVKKHGAEKRYTKAQVKLFMEALLSKENLAKLDLESCFKK